MTFRNFQAYLDDQNLITIELEHQFNTTRLSFTLEDDEEMQQLQIKTINHETDKVYYILLSSEAIDLTKHYWIYDQDRNKAFLQFRHIVQKPLFEQVFAYTGDDLGALYRPDATTFKLWAPLSEQVLLSLKGDAYPMKRADKGVWQVEISGDLEGASYYYLHRVNGNWVEVHDPYALSSTANSGASYVIDPAKFKQAIKRATTQVPMTQSIIYEMSVRDFSMQKEAGFHYPGKFKSLTESPILDGHPLGLDYVKKLGVTHVQLMPLYDFGSVDEKHPHLVYNWGYDPVQYNLPDGSFATNPDDPYKRITELQDAIASYHAADISVIMDVVYNHVYDASYYAFEKIVPGYFFRYDQWGHLTNGTFCGNDVASERTMVRQYIKQSLKQWVTIYGFDGFRFDLMGILDITTMQEIATELQDLYPNIYLYGEGWAMETGLDNTLLAHQFNADQLTNYGFFSDHFRNTIKETVLQSHQLVSQGFPDKIENVLTANVGLVGPAHFVAPHQAINYVECHDNATAFDYFDIQKEIVSLEERLADARLALHLVLLAQGVPFIHSGQEFFRSKNLLDNTYNVPDSINQLDWLRSIVYQKDVEFIRQLIQFRKDQPLLSLASSQEILETCQVKWLSPSLLEYHISGKDRKLTILVNFGQEDAFYESEYEQALLVCYPNVGLKKPLQKGISTYTIPAKQVLVLE